MPKQRLPLLALSAGFLAACSAAPLVIHLQPFSVHFPAAVDTSGHVLYPANPATFDRSVVNVKTIRVDGTVTASNIYTDMTFTVYGRVKNPKDDSSCTSVGVGTYYLCPRDREEQVSTPMTFRSAGPQEQPVGFGGPVVVSGVNHGKIWLGANVEGTGAVDAKLEFTRLRASVTLF